MIHALLCLASSSLMLLRFIYVVCMWFIPFLTSGESCLGPQNVFFYLNFVCFSQCIGLIFRLFGSSSFDLYASQLKSRRKNKLSKIEILELDLNLD